MKGKSRTLTVALLLIVAAVLTWRIEPFSETGRTSGQAAADAVAIETKRATQMTEELAINFPEAPAPVLDVARLIMAGEVPSAEMLAALGVEALNQSWSRPMPDVMPMAGHSLLRQATQSRNVAAAAALIAAGADIHYNEDEMPFAALDMEEPDDLVWFPDYSRGNALLSLWLAAGGEVNSASNPAYGSRSLLQTAPIANLEGIILLLQAGADPWQAPAEGINSDGSIYYGESFAEFNANANPQVLEVTFRVARLGFYRNGTAEQNKRLLELYDQTASQYVGSTGPENLHIIWLLQRVLPLILEQTGQTPTPAIASILATQVPDGIGGFFLAQDEIRSPPDEDQRVTNDNQTGHERWQ
jgi:hypothetical protein